MEDQRWRTYNLVLDKVRVPVEQWSWGLTTLTLQCWRWVLHTLRQEGWVGLLLTCHSQVQAQSKP